MYLDIVKLKAGNEKKPEERLIEFVKRSVRELDPPADANDLILEVGGSTVLSEGDIVFSEELDPSIPITPRVEISHEGLKRDEVKEKKLRSRTDPLRGFKFRVESLFNFSTIPALDGLLSLETPVYKITGLEESFGVELFKNKEKKVSFHMGLSLDNDYYNWFKKSKYYNGLKKNIAIYVYNRGDSEYSIKYILKRCIPRTFSFGELDCSSSKIVEQRLDVSCEEIEMIVNEEI